MLKQIVKDGKIMFDMENPTTIGFID